jgi:UDP-glucose 4-epimerase
MAEVLITGAFGYVGGRVAMHLASCGHSLRLGTRAAGIALPETLRQSRVTACDLFDEKQLDAACRDVQCVVHLASINENASAADPVMALHVNGSGTLRMLAAAARAGVSRFIYLSTAHVYGAPLSGRISEATLPRPLHPYAISHRVAEDFVLAAHDRRVLDGIVMRLSNGCGAPARAGVDRWTLLVNDLCRQAAGSRRMVMRSPGLDTRDFITLEDTARAVAHFIGLDRTQLGDGLFNVGSGASLPVFAVAELIAGRCAAVLGFAPAIERPAAPATATALAALDYRIDKLRATGFAPRARLQDEIDATLRLCRDAFAAQT